MLLDTYSKMSWFVCLRFYECSVAWVSISLRHCLLLTGTSQARVAVAAAAAAVAAVGIISQREIRNEFQFTHGYAATAKRYRCKHFP